MGFQLQYARKGKSEETVLGNGARWKDVWLEAVVRKDHIVWSTGNMRLK